MTGSSLRKKFTHEDLNFRPVEIDDLEMLRKLRNHPTTRSQLTDDRIVTRRAQTKWFHSIKNSGSRAYLVVSHSEYGFVGLVRMDEYDSVNKSIRVGADVVPKLRGRGLGRKIYAGIKYFCFQRLRLHRVWLAVLQTNTRARRLYLRQGFQEEGRYRQAILRKAKYHDYVIMSILEKEYKGDPTI